MKKKIVPLLLVLVILFVLLAILNPEFREKIHVVIDYIGNWLGIEWGSIRGWRSAQLFLC
jgi:predicted PurR-regulated permease PerM